jgi:hypothetical protein
MVDDGDEPDPSAVLAAFRLEGPVTAWAAVGGAWTPSMMTPTRKLDCHRGCVSLRMSR